MRRFVLVWVAAVVAAVGVSGVASSAATSSTGLRVSMLRADRFASEVQAPDGSIVVGVRSRPGADTWLPRRVSVGRGGQVRVSSVRLGRGRALVDLQGTRDFVLGEGVQVPLSGQPPTLRRLRGRFEIAGPTRLPFPPDGRWTAAVGPSLLAGYSGRGKGPTYLMDASGRRTAVAGAVQPVRGSGSDAVFVGADGVYRTGAAGVPVVSWPYPGQATTQDPWNGTDADGRPWAFFPTSARVPGDSEGFVGVARTTAPLKEPFTNRGGDRVDVGAGDAALVRVSLSREPVRVLPVPVPNEWVSDCEAASSTIGTRGLIAGSAWNGPAGELWLLAACGSTSPMDLSQEIRHVWLVRWATGPSGPTAIRLPKGPRSQYGAGFTMADGRMYVFTSSGLYRVSGLPRPFGRASVASVQTLKSGRVRVRVQCVGEPGQACFGRVVVRDARGKLVAMPYGTDAGTVAQLPIVTREFRPRRAVRGELSVVLAR